MEISTHSLAMILFQPDDNESEGFDCAAIEIPRLKKQEIKDADLPDVSFVQYVGPKKPAIPIKQTLQHVSRLKVLATAAASRSIASRTDIQFFKCVTAEPKKTPEYSG